MSRNILILIIAAFWFHACSESRSGKNSAEIPVIKEDPKNNNRAYVLEEVVPSQALPGTKISLYGKYIPDSGVAVMFGGCPVDSIVYSSKDYLEIILPAASKAGNTAVQINSHGGKWVSNELAFKVMQTPKDIPSIYWSTHKLYKGGISDDGSVYHSMLFNEKHPRGLQIDRDHNLIYWGNSWGQIFEGDIEKKKTRQILNVGWDLLDIVIDQNKEWAYYSKEDTIRRINLADTAKVEVLFTDCKTPDYLRLSDDGKQLYWSEYNSTAIKKGSIKGGIPALIADATTGLAGPRGFDLVGGKIYIADSPAFGKSAILEYDEKAKKTKTLWRTEDGIGEMLYDIVADQDTGFLYWMNSKGKNYNNRHDGAIFRAPIDKSLDPIALFMPINYGYKLSL